MSFHFDKSMSLTTLSAEYMHGAFLQACFAVVSQREKLNAINIFPVADGDTGDNMAATAMAIIRYALPKPTIAETLQSIADAGILGARGNSGMIFSQFFNGLLEKAPDVESIPTPVFADILLCAAQSVRQAILHPVEGTMLTMIEKWASLVGALAAHHDCYNELLARTHQELEKTLESTAHTIQVLEEAHVVDAGALGFYHFIEGFTDFLAHPKPLPTAPEEQLACDHHDHELPSADAPPDFRYCTEAILNVAAIDKHQLGEQLEQFGDSVVLTANQRMCRFHLHTNEPWNVFSSIGQLGKIEQPKVDDMRRQFESLHTKQHAIGLVVDSCADIPQDLLDAYQIHLLPINVYIDGHHFLDRFCIDNTTLYNTLSSHTVYPTTSLPTPAMVEAKFRQLSAIYEHVVVMSVSKGLSGTHDALVGAAAAFKNIHVINTRQTAGGQGLLAIQAAKRIHQGVSLSELISEVTDLIRKTHQYVAVEHLDSLVRSGRVPKLAGTIAKLAGLKPILSFDEEGKGIVYDKAFSTPKALHKIVSTVAEFHHKNGLEAYCVVHAGALDKAKHLAAMTTEAFGHPPLFIECVSPGIGLHAGQGCVAIAAISK